VRGHVLRDHVLAGRREAGTEHRRPEPVSGRHPGQPRKVGDERDLVVQRVDGPPAQREDGLVCPAVLAVAAQDRKVGRGAKVGDVELAVAESLRQPAVQVSGELAAGEHLDHPGTAVDLRGAPDPRHQVGTVAVRLAEPVHRRPGQAAGQRRGEGLLPQHRRRALDQVDLGGRNEAAVELAGAGSGIGQEAGQRLD
jgi:hypothetical protein